MKTEIILQQAIQQYGTPAQMDMMIEEMSELTKAILKYRRNPEIRKVNEILSEMADVKIMLKQMELMFGDCSAQEAFKINRLRERLGLA